jgi:hypothetical protein
MSQCANLCKTLCLDQEPTVLQILSVFSTVDATDDGGGDTCSTLAANRSDTAQNQDIKTRRYASSLGCHLLVIVAQLAFVGTVIVVLSRIAGRYPRTTMTTPWSQAKKTPSATSTNASRRMCQKAKHLLGLSWLDLERPIVKPKVRNLAEYLAESAEGLS